MASSTLEDHYLALGVAKDATAAAIKTQFRKLALKFHPDKIQDESQKQAAVDQFHQIRSAYEVIGDEDRRARYDAQCKLAELRKEVIDRHGATARAPDSRGHAYKTSSSSQPSRPTPFHSRGPSNYSGRMSPEYEERRPAYASSPESYDMPSTGTRKASDYERSSKRASPRSDRERAKPSSKDYKKSERADREERSRRTARDIQRDRDRKASYGDVGATTSDSDGYDRGTRRMREDDSLRQARDRYHEQARRQKEDAVHGYYDGDERARKLYSQYDGAKDYIGRSSRRGDSERPVSPSRTASKDKFTYYRGRDGRPTVVRRDSNRPRTSARDSEQARTLPRRPSDEYHRRPSVEIVDEPRYEIRRPPGLSQSKSSPAEIRMPFEKPRAHSVQLDQDYEDDPAPRIRRSETMPLQGGGGRDDPRDARRSRDIPPNSSRHNRRYADDGYVSDGYRTELHEPSGPARSSRQTRSPSPMRDRDRIRTSSSKYAPTGPPRPSNSGRTTSTSYFYGPSGHGEPVSGRPSMSRETSSRSEKLLFNEIPSSRSPKVSSSSKFPSSSSREIRPENLQPATGYGYVRRPSEQRTYVARPGAGSPVSAW